MGRYYDIYLKAEEIPGKRQRRDCLMKPLRQVIASNGFLYFQMTTVEWHSTSGRKKGGKKKI